SDPRPGMEAVAGRHVVALARDVADEPAPLVALARACYPDMAVSVEPSATHWRLCLEPLAPVAAAYDRELSAVLATLGTDPAGIGSYITPFLWAVPADVVHLAPSEPGGGQPHSSHPFSVVAAPVAPGDAMQRLVVEHGEAGRCRYQRLVDPLAIGTFHRPG